MKTKNIRTTQKIEYTSKKIHDLGLVAVYENTDFLTVKLSKTHPSVLTLDGLVPNSDVMRLDFGNFRVQYFGLVA
jgi:hypothetical protein